MLGMSGLQLPFAPMPGPNATAAQLVGSFNKSQAASVAANQDLYNRSSNAYDRIYNEARAGAQNAWKWLKGSQIAGRRAIDKQYTKDYGNMMQNLIDSGLGNATIQGSMGTGLQVAHQDALSNHRAAWAEKMFNAKRMGYLDIAGIGQHGVDSLLQNTRIGYPDAGAYASMIAASSGGAGMGAAGGMAGGGGTVMYDPSRPIGGPRPAWTYGSPNVAFEGGGGGGYESLAEQSARAAATPTYSAASLYAAPEFQMPDLSGLNFARGAWDNG